MKFHDSFILSIELHLSSHLCDRFFLSILSVTLLLFTRTLTRLAGQFQFVRLEHREDMNFLIYKKKTIDAGKSDSAGQAYEESNTRIRLRFNERLFDFFSIIIVIANPLSLTLLSCLSLSFSLYLRIFFLVQIKKLWTLGSSGYHFYDCLQSLFLVLTIDNYWFKFQTPEHWKDRNIWQRHNMRNALQSQWRDRFWGKKMLLVGDFLRLWQLFTTVYLLRPPPWTRRVKVKKPNFDFLIWP